SDDEVGGGPGWFVGAEAGREAGSSMRWRWAGGAGSVGVRSGAGQRGRWRGGEVPFGCRVPEAGVFWRCGEVAGRCRLGSGTGSGSNLLVVRAERLWVLPPRHGLPVTGGLRLVARPVRVRASPGRFRSRSGSRSRVRR